MLEHRRHVGGNIRGRSRAVDAGRPKWRRGLAAAVSGLALCSMALLPHAASSAPLSVTIDTSLLFGQGARLAFALLDGDFAPDNSVTISNLASDGTFGASDCSVGCSGGPPFVVDDTLAFGEFLQDLTLGTYVKFDLAFTSAFSGNNAPDRFTLNLLDPNTNFTLVDTDLDFLVDPVPAQDALLLIDLQDPATVRLAGQGLPIVATVPEPATPALVLLALAALLRRRA